MNNEQQLVFGSWIQAIGTTVAAIGATPSKILSEEQLEGLSVIGNVGQAVGNALIADTIEEFDLTKAGNEIQSIGNLTVISGIVIDFDEDTKLNLDISGNLLQALGGSAAVSETFNEDPSVDVLLAIYGDLLQVIGNSLQAIAGIIESKDRDSGNINEIGSWIQAIGSILAALVTSKEVTENLEENNRNNQNAFAQPRTTNRTHFPFF
ncbi:hypothetical protein WAK64_08320 [Bacillus spongiae]|uniref:Uncharacterized protein n=1 Tax=Bacillus spongiae TaxID=2683610 RepID=A0ABU8HCK8_9BACI